MGLFSTIKGEAHRGFIVRPDHSKQDIIYRHTDRNIRFGSQLTVMADERALFFRDGKLAGQIGPGRHTLESNNFPFLSILIDAVSGGNLFVTEIYFVSMREISQIKFGGPIGDLRDPGTGLAVGTMVHGDFSLRVTDPAQLVIGLVGMQRTTNDAFIGWFKSQVLKTIRDRTAELVVKKRWPLLDVTSGAYTEEIEVEVIQGVKRHTESYGLEIVRLGNFNISMKKEDEETLKQFKKDTAYSQLAGGYQAYAAGQAMMGAGKGMAKGGGEGGGGSGMAMTGAGLGMGFGMANMFMGQQMHQQPHSGAAYGHHAPPPPPPHYGQHQHHAGPPRHPYAPPPPVPPGSPHHQAHQNPQTSPTQPDMVDCSACNQKVPQGKFCVNCGTPIPEPKAEQATNCGKCGTDTIPGARFCPGCGNPLGA